VEVVQQLSRRVHLRVPFLAHHRSACERIAHRLARDFEHHRVAVRPLTGSVIVQRETGSIDGRALVSRLSELLAREHDEQGRPLFEPRDVAGPTPLARAILSAVRDINGDVKRALDGKGDMATLAPLVMAASAVGRIAATGDISHVPWFNMFWFSLQSFLSFNAAERAAESSGVPPATPHEDIGAASRANGS